MANGTRARVAAGFGVGLGDRSRVGFKAHSPAEPVCSKHVAAALALDRDVHDALFYAVQFNGHRLPEAEAPKPYLLRRFVGRGPRDSAQSGLRLGLG